MSSLLTKFHYLLWDPIYETEKPFQIYSDIPPEAEDKRQTNLKFELAAAAETIEDVRGRESLFTLDSHGFQYIKHHSNVSEFEFYEGTGVEDKYLPECEEVLKQQLDGVDEILLFDWRIRRSETSFQHGQRVDFNDRHTVFGPVKTPHVDASPGYVVDVVERNFPDRADFLLSGRARWINLWRPLGQAVECCPLAVSDGTTVSEAGLVETNRVRRALVNSTLFSLYQDGVKWYYMSQQTPSDLLIFKNFDSQEGVARYAMHSAVESATSVNKKPRESIEVRMLVFTYPETDEPREE